MPVVPRTWAGPSSGDGPRPFTLFALPLALFFAPPAGAEGLPLDKIKLPPGFSISVYAADVAGARSLALSPSGVLFVGTRSKGRVYAVVDDDKDRKADRVLVLARGLDMPNGVAFRGGSLYVAEVSRLLRFDGIEARLEDPPEPVVVYDKLPGVSHHGWKYIAFGPDGRLYVPVGAPCNVCENKDPRFASIMTFSADGSSAEIFAKGVRNSVGFDWHPQTKELWFTDNGRDRLGDDLPPDELNRAPRPGLHFGFPYCHGRSLADPDYGKGKDCADYEPAAAELGPHVAALGMEFYRGDQFPAAYRGRAFLAEHGSWNRSERIGYRVMTVDVSKSPPAYEPFAQGWLDGGKRWGRPVDVETMADGSLLVSDDYADAIYRVSYTEPRLK